MTLNALSAVNCNWLLGANRLAVRPAHTLERLVGILIGFTAGALYWLGQYSADYVNRQEEGARERGGDPDTKCYTIFGVTSLCIGSDKDARAEAERSEQDLQAQQNMAEWAKALTILTFAQLGVGIVGTVLLLDNLRQGRVQAHAAQRAVASNTRANVIARDAYAANERPWVRIKFEAITLVDLRFDKGSARVEVENIGKTPALDVSVTLYPMIVRAIQPDKGHLRKLVQRTLRNAPHGSMLSVIAFPNDPFPLRANESRFEELDLPNRYNSGKVAVAMFAVCTYRSNLSESYWHTAIGVKVIHTMNGGARSTQAFDMDGDPVGVDNLTFKPDSKLTSVS